MNLLSEKVGCLFQRMPDVDDVAGTGGGSVEIAIDSAYRYTADAVSPAPDAYYSQVTTPRLTKAKEVAMRTKVGTLGSVRVRFPGVELQLPWSPPKLDAAHHCHHCFHRAEYLVAVLNVYSLVMMSVEVMEPALVPVPDSRSPSFNIV